MSERQRLNLELTPALVDRLEHLGNRVNASKTDLVRMGLEMLFAADTAVRDGLTVGAWGRGPQEGTRIEREFINAVTQNQKSERRS